MFDDPEAAVRMVNEGDSFAESGGDFIVVAIEVNGEDVVDAAGTAKGKVEVEQRGWRRGTYAAFAPLGLRVPDFEGSHLVDGAIDGAVLACDFHLENVVGLLVSFGTSVREECHESALEGAKAAFDLALGLRGGGDQMCHTKPAESALKLAFRIAVIVAGAWAEETQAVGVNDLWKPPCLEGFTEVLEVIPCRV